MMSAFGRPAMPVPHTTSSPPRAPTRVAPFVTMTSAPSVPTILPPGVPTMVAACPWHVSPAAAQLDSWPRGTTLTTVSSIVDSSPSLTWTATG